MRNVCLGVRINPPRKLPELPSPAVFAAPRNTSASLLECFSKPPSISTTHSTPRDITACHDNMPRPFRLLHGRDGLSLPVRHHRPLAFLKGHPAIPSSPSTALGTLPAPHRPNQSVPHSFRIGEPPMCTDGLVRPPPAGSNRVSDPTIASIGSLGDLFDHSKSSGIPNKTEFPI